MSEGHARASFNLVVRALILRESRLLVSRWQGAYCFPIGGRIEPGETLKQAVLREVQEETGMVGHIRRLAYFHENFFTDPAGAPVHELGWYFWIEPEQPIGTLGERWAHPDSPRLFLEYVPLEGLERAELMPHFLRTLLPDDHAQGFGHCPRHVISRERLGGTPEHFLLREGWDEMGRML